MDRQWNQRYDRTYQKQSAPQRDYIKQSHDFVAISNLPFLGDLCPRLLNKAYFGQRSEINLANGTISLVNLVDDACYATALVLR
jgi:hypothetical protein